MSGAPAPCLPASFGGLTPARRLAATEQQFKFTQPIICKNPTCAGRRNFHLHIDKSKFVDFQRIRVQENSNEIPAGSMPRSIDVIVRNEQVALNPLPRLTLTQPSL